jgi:hypothetical protein
MEGKDGQVSVGESVGLLDQLLGVAEPMNTVPHDSRGSRRCLHEAPNEWRRVVDVDPAGSTPLVLP